MTAMRNVLRLHGALLLALANSASERRETFTVPMRKIGDLTLVRSFLRG